MQSVQALNVNKIKAKRTNFERSDSVTSINETNTKRKSFQCFNRPKRTIFQHK